VLGIYSQRNASVYRIAQFSLRRSVVEEAPELVLHLFACETE
jgi:hypothetical protein